MFVVQIGIIDKNIFLNRSFIIPKENKLKPWEGFLF